MTSNVKRLHNEIIALEEGSDSYIPYDKYYVIRIAVLNRENFGEGDQALHVITQELLSANPNHQPLVTYVHDNEVFLLFSCLSEGEKHYRNGSHQLLCSEYCNYFYKALPYEPTSVTTCRIIVISSQTKVFAYFSWIVYQRTLATIVSLSKKQIKEKDTSSFPITELVEKLESKCNVKWSKVSSSDKFGTFYKLKKKKSKLYISSMSEAFDAREDRKYITYLFG
jgi:hypothetical protein